MIGTRALITIAFLTGVGFYSTAGFAAGSIAATEERPDVFLTVPQADIDFSKYPDPSHVAHQAHLEINASNWAPAGFSSESTLDNTDEFHSDGVPKISINSWTDRWQLGSALNLAPKFGLSYDQLLRNGTLDISGQTHNISQTMNLFSARAGVELTPQNDFFGHLQPFAGVNLLPTWAQASESQFNDGESHLYFSFEETAGLNWQVQGGASWLGAKTLGIEIGLDATQGVAGSPLSGFGILAGTRIDL